MKTPEYMLANLQRVKEVVDSVRCGTVHTLCQSAGGREVYMVEYGKNTLPRSTANYSSALGARDITCYADRTHESYIPTLMLVGCVHGGEFEGTAGILNLIHIMETGTDFLGADCADLRCLANELHLLLIPVQNPDGRSHIPLESFVGETFETLRYYNQGTWLDGSLCNWPDCKKIHPIKNDVSYLGGYFNDDGINLMHDDFFGHMASENQALLDACKKYAPDVAILLHGGTNTVDALLQTSYASGSAKKEAIEIAQLVKAEMDKEGLQFDPIPDTMDAGEDLDIPESFNLPSAMHHACGGVCLVYESNQGLIESEEGPGWSQEEIYRHHMVLFETLMWHLYKRVNCPFKPTLDKASVTDADFAQAKANFKRYYVGDAHNDLSNAVIRGKIAQIEQIGKDSRALMNRDPDAPVLFGDKLVTETVEMNMQYHHMVRMARAWGTCGSALYRDETLLKDILYALEYLYQHYYGQREIDGCGWRDTRLHNWWNWYVGVPNCLEETLVILDDALTQAQIDRYMSCFHHIRTRMCRVKNTVYAPTRTKVCTLAAILSKDVDLMSESMVDIDMQLPNANGDCCVCEDGTYLIHNYYHYVGSYATDILVNRVMLVAGLLAGTRFACQSADKYNMVRWIYDVFEPFMYGGNLMSMVNGRAFECGDAFGAVAIQGALSQLGVFSAEEDQKLKQFIRRNVDKDNLDYMLSELPLSFAMKLLSVMEEEITLNPYTVGRVYYCGDRVVQQRPDYAVGIAMHSTRTGNYECINSDNIKGWHTGDGMLYVYNDKVKGFDRYGRDYYKTVNKYRLSGTTEDVRERSAVSIAHAYPGKTEFVGGVSFENTYAAAAFDFEAYHYEKDPVFEDDGYGGDFPKHANDLVAKKSYFLFDDEIVALGAGITSTMDADVYTYAENRRPILNGKAAKGISVDGDAFEGETASFHAPQYIHMDCFGGYYFPQAQQVTVNKGDYHEIMIAHGKNPTDAGYAYVLLPNKTEEETADYAKAPDITILSNTKALAAVRENKLQLTAAAFYEAGRLGGIRVSKPLLLMYRQEGDTLTLSVADPTQKLSNAQVILDEKWLSVQADPEVTVLNGQKTVVNFYFAKASGKTITVTLKK